MSDAALKVREKRARRAAQRRGWGLEKSRARDPHALGYGHYLLLDAERRPVFDGDIHLSEVPYSLTLDRVEELLGLTRT